MKSLLFSLLLASSLPHAGAVAIHGPDDRKDFYEITDPHIRDITESIAHIVYADDLIELPDGNFTPRKQKPMTELYQFCEDTKFADQIPLGHCSAALVGQDKLLTAGHCFYPQPGHARSFKKMVAVFDYKLQAPGEKITIIKKENVFRLDELLHYEFDAHAKEFSWSWFDLALVKLDRTPTRPALPVDTNFKYQPGTPLYMLGFPLGLPMKLSDNGQILSDVPANHAFRHDLETFSSNSGGAIFDARTNKIIGVLVRGPIPNTTTYGRECQDWYRATSRDALEEGTYLWKLRSLLE